MNEPTDETILKAILDAGEGVKFDADKPKPTLLDPHALIQIARVMEHGERKYGRDNWRLGMKTCRILDAMLRHILAFQGGEDLDPETGIHHIAHAGANCMMLLGLSHRTDLDDRSSAPKPAEPTKECTAKEMADYLEAYARQLHASLLRPQKKQS